jgi:hypothetical protein
MKDWNSRFYKQNAMQTLEGESTKTKTSSVQQKSSVNIQ